MTEEFEPANQADSIINAARQQAEVKTLANGAEVIVVPAGSTVQTLSKPVNTPLPTRLVIRRVFHDGDSFARYVNRYKQTGSQLIADIDRSKVVAVIDYPDEDDAEVARPDPVPPSIPAREHVAEWPVRYSEAFAAWNAINGKLLPQADFLRFLEENVGEVMRPDPARILELVKDFSAVKTDKFESSKRLQNGDAALVYITETNVKQGLEVPQKLGLAMPIYHGEGEIAFDAWFRYRIASGALLLGIEFHRIEPVKQAAFRAAVARAVETAGVDPHYGEAI
jgi:uncharacterized protein YfdQ (DUF2303 family)